MCLIKKKEAQKNYYIYPRSTTVLNHLQIITFAENLTLTQKAHVYKERCMRGTLIGVPSKSHGITLDTVT